MQNTITIESLLGIAMGFVSDGVALVTADKIITGVIITAIGFTVIGARAFLKKNNC